MKLDAVLDKKVRRLVLLCGRCYGIYDDRCVAVSAAATTGLSGRRVDFAARRCRSDCRWTNPLRNALRFVPRRSFRRAAPMAVRLANGLLPAPPHDASGHTWHHGDSYLFAVTKYGIERLLGQHYPNAMPIYDGVLSDREIIAVLSYIKSQWPAEIQSRHDRLNQQLRGQNN